MNAAKRHRKLVAYLSSKGTWFGIAQVMCIGRRSPAYEARLRGDVLQVFLVAPPPRLERGTFLDWNALGALIRRRGWLGFLIPARCRSGLAGFASPNCHHLSLKRRFKCARILRGQRVLGWQGTLRPGKRFLKGASGNELGLELSPQRSGLGARQGGSDGPGYRLARCEADGIGGRQNRRCIEVVLARNADEGEGGIASGVGQSRPHALRGSRLTPRAYRPFGRDPLGRRVRQ